MTEEKSRGSSSSGLGCLAPLVGIAGLVATFALGPIDLGRSVYNQVIGDTPVLKRQLVEYCRRDVQSNHPGESSSSVERHLANELSYHFPARTAEEGTGQIDPNQVSIEALWDASEDHAQSTYQRWVWPSLTE